MMESIPLQAPYPAIPDPRPLVERHPDPRVATEQWLQDALAAEHRIRKIAGSFCEHALLDADLELRLLALQIQHIAEVHQRTLEQAIEAGGGRPSALRSAAATGVGAGLAWWERVQSRELPYVVRHLFSALNHAAGTYHVLYTHAALIDDDATAELALRHLHECTPCVRRSSRLLAWATALAFPGSSGFGASRTVDDIAATLEEAWSSNVPWPEPAGRPGADTGRRARSEAS